MEALATTLFFYGLTHLPEFQLTNEEMTQLETDENSNQADFDKMGIHGFARQFLPSLHRSFNLKNDGISSYPNPKLAKKNRKRAMDLKISRLDHFGVVSGIIKDLKLIEQIDTLLGTKKTAKISHGEVLAGMILNALGFTDRTLSLTPRFFENKPLDILFRPGIRAEHFNQVNLTRTLDAVSSFGCEKLFETLAASTCRKEQVDCDSACKDSRTFSLTGQYHLDEDTQTVAITNGYSKDHPSDQNRVGLELMLSQDGGIPLLMRFLTENNDENSISKNPSKPIMEVWSELDGPRYVVKENIEKGFGFLNSPLCFASSFFLEKTSRIEGLILVMTLSLLVYSTVQRRFRKALEGLDETIPNQGKQLSERHSMRQVFKMLEGINHVSIKKGQQIKVLMEGEDLNDLRRNVLSLLGDSVSCFYQIVPYTRRQ